MEDQNKQLDVRMFGAVHGCCCCCGSQSVGHQQPPPPPYHHQRPPPPPYHQQLPPPPPYRRPMLSLHEVKQQQQQHHQHEDQQRIQHYQRPVQAHHSRGHSAPQELQPSVNCRQPLSAPVHPRHWSYAAVEQRSRPYAQREMPGPSSSFSSPSSSQCWCMNGNYHHPVQNHQSGYVHEDPNQKLVQPLSPQWRYTDSERLALSNGSLNEQSGSNSRISSGSEVSWGSSSNLNTHRGGHPIGSNYSHFEYAQTFYPKQVQSQEQVYSQQPSIPTSFRSSQQTTTTSSDQEEFSSCKYLGRGPVDIVAATSCDPTPAAVSDFQNLELSELVAVGDTQTDVTNLTPSLDSVLPSEILDLDNIELFL